MSPPIAELEKRPLKGVLIALHQQLSHLERSR
jgi:hypothetical protein